MRRTVSYIALSIFSLAVLGSTALAQDVFSYNGPRGADPATAGGSRYPGDNFFYGTNALKTIMRDLNANNNVNINQPGMIYLRANLVGDAAGVNDMNFQAVNVNKRMRIHATAAGNIIESNNAPIVQNPQQPWPNYIPMFRVVSGGILEFAGDNYAGPLTIRYASRRTNGDGGAVQAQGILRNLVDMVYDQNETTGNGGAIALVGGQLNPDAWPGGGTNTFTANHANINGGAVFVSSGSADFRNTTTFTNNWAWTLASGVGNLTASPGGGGGGAVYATGSTVRFFTGGSAHTFTNNIGSQSGGAINAVANSSITFMDDGTFATFTGNSARTQHGGAINLESSTLTMRGAGAVLPSFANQFITNSAYHNGGAIRAIGNSTVTLGDVFFDGNQAGVGVGVPNPAGNRYGGAIYSEASRVNITGNSMFQNNATVGNINGGGGAIYMNGNILSFGGVAGFFGNNTGALGGGGIHSVGATVQFLSAAYFGDGVVAGNSAGGGGAIYANGGSYSFADISYFGRNRAVVDNSAINGEGGAIYGVNGVDFLFVDHSKFGGSTTLANFIWNFADPDSANHTIALQNINANSGNYAGRITVASGDPNAGALVRTGGGAVRLDNSTMTFQKDAEFYVNEGSYGGAIHGLNSTFTFGSTANPSNTIFGQNNAIYGGAINANNSTFTFNSGLANHDHITAFVSNGTTTTMGTTSRQGGAISANTGSRLTFIGGTIFQGNQTLLSHDSASMPFPVVMETAGGGAIYSNSATFSFNAGTIRETRFDRNTSVTSAGAIFAENNSTFTFDGTTRFLNNIANGTLANHGHGGAILAVDSSFTFNAPEGKVEFVGNEAQNNGDGGAIVAGTPDSASPSSGNATFTFTENTPVLFSLNTADRDAGAIRANGSTFTFNGPIGQTLGNPLDYGFLNNTAGRYGGAIMAENASRFIFNNLTTFDHNVAGSDGGAIYAQSGSSLQFNYVNQFTNNEATRDGGAIKLTGTGSTLNMNATYRGDSLFQENTAGRHGGAINIDAGAVATIVGNAKFIENEATAGFGGAIYMDDATVNLRPDAQGREILFDGNEDSSDFNAVYLNGSSTLNLTPSSGAKVVFHDQIASNPSGSGNVINMNGPGTIELHGVRQDGTTPTGTSVYYGDTNLSAGRFELKYNANGSASYGDNSDGIFTVTNNATVVMERDTTLAAEHLILDAGRIEVSGTAKPTAGNDTVAALDAHQITLNAGGGTFDIKTGHQLTINQGIDGVGDLTKAGTGVLVMNAQQDYTGRTIITEGTLRLTDTSGETLINSSILQLQGTSILDLADQDQRIVSLDGSATSQIKFETNPGSSANDNVLTIETQAGNDTTYAGLISGYGVLRKEGQGRLTLSGRNTFAQNNATYGTEIIGGTLGIANVYALGTGTVGIGGGGTLEMNVLSHNNGEFRNDIEGYGGTAGDIVKTGNGRVMITGNVALTNPDRAQGNIFVGNGTLAVGQRSGTVGPPVFGQINANNVIVGSTNSINGATGAGVLEVINRGQVVSDFTAQFKSGSTFSVTITENKANWFNSDGEQLYGPQLIANDQIMIEDGATLNLNIGRIDNIGGNKLVIMHGKNGIVQVDENGTQIDPNILGGRFTNISIGGIGYTEGEYNEDSPIVVRTHVVAHDDRCPVTDDSLAAGDYVIDYGLAWYAGNELAHGTFNIVISDLFPDGTFTLGTTLNNHVNTESFLNDVSENPGRWDGKTLTKKGSGTLILEETNNYSGNTYILDGTLVANKTTSLGTGSDVFNNGTLQFDLAAGNGGTFTKTISGSGGLVKSGAATLNLIGDHSYAGPTLVTGGKLNLNGSIGKSAVKVTGNGTTLSGSGVLGSLVITGDNNGNAYLKPGDDGIGKFDVNGKVTFGENSVFDIQVSADMQYDRVIAKGGDLSGGTIRITAAPDRDYTRNQYVYDGIFTGDFGDTKFKDEDISDLETLANNIGYTAELYYSNKNKVSLVLVRGDFTFTGGTFNQDQVGAGLDQLVKDDELRNEYRLITQNLRNLSRSEMLRAQSQMAGDVKANALMLGQWDVARPTLNRLNLDPCNLTDMPRYGRKLHNVWIDSTYQEMTMLGDGNARGYRISRPGLMLGVDRKVLSNTTMGLFFGYSNPILSCDNDRVEANDFQLGYYVGTTFNNGLEMKGYVGLGLQGYDSRRVVDNPALSPTPAVLLGSYQGSTLISTFELSRPLVWSWGIIRPIAALDLMTTTHGGHTEDGDPLLAGDYQRVHFGRAWARAGARLELAQTDLTSLWFHMFYAFKFAGEDAPEAKFRFARAPEMSRMVVRGSDPGSSYLSLGFGNYWNLNIQKTRQLTAHYDLFVSQRETQNTISLGYLQKF